MKKRVWSILLALILALSLFPVTGLAADVDWAKDAVTTLNNIYGSGVFFAEDATMKEKDAADIVSAAQWATTVSLDDTDATPDLSRQKACEVLADVFALPIGSQSAIKYLYDKNIINGKADGDLDEKGPVTQAEFAVLTYRVLNSVGGGLGSKENWPAPGSEGYMAWMYLAVRKCVPFEMDQANTTIKNVTIATYTGSSYKENDDRTTIAGGTTKIYDVTTASKTGQEIWNAWTVAMQDSNIGGNADFSAPDYDENETLLEAAIRMVAARNDVSPVIFHDITAGSWFYDGIMYLVNNDIVVGYGDGKFGPDDITPRYELAMLLTNVEGVTLSTESGLGRVIEAIQYVVENGYMTGTVSGDENWNPMTDSYWSAPATREETTVGILKMIANKEKITTTNGNTTILDRFTDVEDIADEDSKPYLAYAVSTGLLSGTSTNTLEPDGEVSRAQVGVLLYRTLIGLDTSKMHDYEENVDHVLAISTPSGDDSQGGGTAGQS